MPMLTGNVILVKQNSLDLVDQGRQGTEASATSHLSVHNGSLLGEPVQHYGLCRPIIEQTKVTSPWNLSLEILINMLFGRGVALPIYVS